MKAKYTIQCTCPDTGKTGDWLFSGDDHREKGTQISPVFTGLTELFGWMKRNGWEIESYGLAVKKVFKPKESQ